MMDLGLYAGLAFFAGLVFLFWRIARRSGQHAAAEENLAFERRQREAEAAAAERDRKAHERMADAEAAAVSEPADRIRERMRKRPAGTR